MAKKGWSRRELLDRWSAIEDEDDRQLSSDSNPTNPRIKQKKEEWFLDAFNLLISLPKETHIWCEYWDLMTPLLETFYNYFSDKRHDSPLKSMWKRISQELRTCTQCICQHHQAQDMYHAEYESDTIDPLLNVLKCLDEERVIECLREINATMRRRDYSPDSNNAEVVSIIFEVLMYPSLLESQPLVNEFQVFIEAVDNSHELTLEGHQHYPGVYALLFLKSVRGRSIAHRLAGRMGKLRSTADLEPLQPMLKRCIGLLETEVLPSTLEVSRPRVQLERLAVWIGIKSLLGFMEPSAFEEGILERYPIFVSIVLNHVSDDTLEFTYAINCLRLLFEMLGCKLWFRTTFSPSVMRNTLLGQCFHTRNEKSHKEIFDIFQPFLQSLEALQDGEHEKQRRHFIYFLLHQVTQSSNFSLLMKKMARKIALLIIRRGYTLNPPCPPYECAHTWGPSLISSLKDSSLHNSLRQPAFDLITTVIISDAAALMHLKLKYNSNLVADVEIPTDFVEDDEDLCFFNDVEKDSSCWSEFNSQSRLIYRECKEWICIPILWLNALLAVNPPAFPMSLSKAVIWILSRLSMVEPVASTDMTLSVNDWLSSYARELSTYLVWQEPNGSDDGGEGIKSKNSVNVSTMHMPLLRTLKRCAAYFIIQMEQFDLWKQWTWEPAMAESLILLLMDTNDDVRQVAKKILEHISNSKGLTPGLQFLCSSACSLSATFRGLQYSLKLVLLDSNASKFSSSQHLFFIIRKLFKEVVASERGSKCHADKTNSSKFSSEGGFLLQPHFEQSCVVSQLSSDGLDIELWDRSCFLLAGIIWPIMLKCLMEGKTFLENKACQMACVRLLELFPVVFERLSSPAFGQTWSLKIAAPDVFDFKWFFDLMDWGRLSNAILARHWRNCVHSLLCLFKDLCSIDSKLDVDSFEKLFSSGTSGFDGLKDKVAKLFANLSKGRADILKNKTCQSVKDSLFERRYTTTPVSSEDPDVVILDTWDLSDKNFEKKVIVILDEETEKSVNNAYNKVTSSRQLNQQTLGKNLKVSNAMCNASHSCKPLEGSKGTAFAVPSQKLDNDIDREKLISPKVNSAEGGSSSLGLSKVLENKKQERHGTHAPNSTFPSQEGADKVHDCLVGQEFKHNNLDPPAMKGLIESESDANEQKKHLSTEELTIDKETDPWEIALRSAPLLVKSSVSVPKRQVIQVEMPVKTSSLHRQHASVRRFKPPRLDDWYRPILEIDYFSIVGLSSPNEENVVTTDFQEVPICFQSSDQYVQIFRPLVLEELRAQLHHNFMEVSSPEEMSCGTLCIISVERIDDFHIIRCLSDERESSLSRGCMENDLVLLTKQPLEHSAQSLHLVGKVERREKDSKNKSVILLIRFYLQSGSSRINKVKKLLIVRSKWCVSRIMSITPQLREFQALSSLKDTPMLSIVLNPVDHTQSRLKGNDIELGKLPMPLQRMLKASYNNSQLRALSTAIRTHASNESFELSLIQGPPGTGKTRTILAIVSALLSLSSVGKNSSRKQGMSTDLVTNERAKVSQSVAIARAWQDAALAKQLDKEVASFGLKEDSFMRGRVLICAQSNAAVDELVSRISTCGLYGSDGKMFNPYLVRVGNAKTVHPNSLPFFIDTLVEQRLADEKMKEKDMTNNGSIDSLMTLRSKLENLVDKIRFLEAKRASLLDKDIGSERGVQMLKEQNDQEMSDAAIEANLKILYGKKKTICVELASAQSREKKVSEEVKALKHKLRKSILREAEIVVTTLSGSGGDIYGVCYESVSNQRFGSEDSLFDAVVIDEAAQALEPATLIPLQLLKSSRTKCIMVGDPKQLPATVLSSVASKFLYECSMFERLQRAGHPVVMLTEQYRMHPGICLFPSLYFYENKLLNGDGMTSKTAIFHKDAYFGPYVFFDIIDGHEQRGKNSNSPSLYNEAEADAAVELVRLFIKKYPSEFVGGRIGVITPYKRQLSMLRSRFASAIGSSAMDIEFNTVDGFQGREIDILILSTVRASDPNKKACGLYPSNVGFVADMRRMNVALTRAKFSLWIVGNARTLQTNIDWEALLKNARERNVIKSAVRPYDSMFQKVPQRTSHHSNGSHHNLWKDNKSKFALSEQGKRRSQNALAEGDKEVSARVGRQSEGHVRDSALEGIDRLPGVVTKDHGFSRNAKSATHAVNTSCSGRGKVVLTTSAVAANENDMCDKRSERTYDSKASREEPCSSSRHSKLSDSISSDSTNLGSSKEVNNQELRHGNHILTLGERSKDLIGTRKRQRDAVDALLSSAFISSKKPETLTKHAALRQPISPKTAACEQPKSSKDHPIASKPKPQTTSQVQTHNPQIRRECSSHEGDWNREGKSSKNALDGRRR